MNRKYVYKTLLAGVLSLVAIAALNTNNTSAASSTLSLTISSSTIKASTAPVSANGTFAKATASTKCHWLYSQHLRPYQRRR